HAEAAEPGPAQPRVEVLRLRQEDDLPWGDDRNHHTVDERQVVARDDQPAPTRNVVKPLDSRPPDGLGQRWDDRVQSLVQHRHSLSSTKRYRRVAPLVGGVGFTTVPWGN